MTLADLPVLNPSTPGREARRAAVVAALFAVFGVLYALARATAASPPDPVATGGDPFGFAFPRGWGVIRAAWSGAATWPGRLAAANMETTLAIFAIVLLAIALIIVMHPDILSRQGPQYVSPARRITTVVIALVAAFLVYWGVDQIDSIFGSGIARAPERGPRQLVGMGAVSALLFGGVWSFIGPKDFGRRIPLRISHGALGGLGLWAAATFATYLSAQPRAFLSSSIDTYYTLLTLDAASGEPGATLGWAIGADVLTAAVAMAVAGAILVVTAPQSLGPGNRRGSTAAAGVLFAFLGVVALTTWTQTTERARAVNANVVEALQLGTQGIPRSPVILGGQSLTATQRVVNRFPAVPSATADDCVRDTDERTLPAATAANVNRLASYLQAQGRGMNGQSIRAASCLAALQALRWDPEAARQTVFASERPERAGALTYLFTASGITSMAPAALRTALRNLADTSRYHHGSEAAMRFAGLARLAGDSVTEAAWRDRIIQPSGSAVMSGLLSRPSYVNGTITGRVQSRRAPWRVGLLSVGDPSSGGDPMQSAPRSEITVLSYMVMATSTGSDGRFTFTGLRDGWYILALLSPEGEPAVSPATLQVRGDPGVIRMEPARSSRDVGVIQIDY
jgi:hypothetical protein